MNKLDHDALRGGDWRFMLAALAPCLAYILTAASAPWLLARRLTAGSPLSLGLLLGLGLAAFLVILALIYTRRANRAVR